MSTPESRMSRDRVHFTIPCNMLHKTSIKQCIEESLGLRNAEQLRRMALQDEDLHIICRPSQFARFVILRHVKYNEPNSMACLNMQLVLPPKDYGVQDVSKNPNTAGPSGKNTG